MKGLAPSPNLRNYIYECSQQPKIVSTNHNKKVSKQNTGLQNKKIVCLLGPKKDENDLII